MQKIVCQQAAEGMVLAREVITPEGRTLCGQGTELSAAIIARFLKMEIPYISVEGHPVKVEGEKSLKEQLRDVESRFSKVSHVPPLMFLKNKIMKRLVASMQEEGKP